MRKVLWAVLFVVTMLTAVPTRAQSPNYDVGPVWRVSYYHIKPGQGDAFWKDFRENLKPVYDEVKKEGMISDYKVWTNVTTDGPGDWDVAIGLLYPNYAAFDTIDAKAATAYNLIVMAYPDGRAPARYRRAHPNGPWIYTGGTSWEKNAAIYANWCRVGWRAK